MSRTAVILLAAGAGKRMAGAVPDKVLAAVAGRPVFAYSAAAFAASGVADLYVVVYRDRPQMTALSAFAPTPSFSSRAVASGRTRSPRRWPACPTTSTTCSSTTARGPSSFPSSLSPFTRPSAGSGPSSWPTG